MDLRPWHYDVLFIVGVGGLVFSFIAPSLHIEIPPTAQGGIGLVLAWILKGRTDAAQKRDETDSGADHKEDSRHG